MTMSTPTLEKTVSDVDINMMGIKSSRLYDFLRAIVQENHFGALKESEADEMLPALVDHMTVTIPNDILRNYNRHKDDSFELLKKELKILGQYLLKKFAKQNKYPFTILRICELCYDPLKYYKVHELRKFVHGISKCCLVTDCWSYCEDSNGYVPDRDVASNSDDYQSEDVSLTKIPWINEKTEKELIPFFKEIDSLMSANFAFDDDNDDDMDVDMNNASNRNGDFIIEEYYEEAPGSSHILGEEDDDDDDDDDGDYDDDYVDTPTSDDNDQWNEDEIEKDIDSESGEPNQADQEDWQQANGEDNQENHPEGRQAELQQQQQQQQQERTKDQKERNNKKNEEQLIEPKNTNSQNATMHDKEPKPDRQKVTAYKRKPTELDDFEYKECSNTIENHLLTTPKKMKQDKGDAVLESPEVTRSDNPQNTTPIRSQEARQQKLSGKHVQSPSSEQHIPMLISPKNTDEDCASLGGKIRGVTNRKFKGDVGSPLGNKSR